MIRRRWKEWTCCSQKPLCAVNTSFGGMESDKEGEKNECMCVSVCMWVREERGQLER